MRFLYLLAAGLCAGAVVAPAASDRPAGGQRGAAAFPMPEEPKEVNPQNPDEAMGSFCEFCWQSFLAINRAGEVKENGEAGEPGGLSDSLKGDRPLWMGWLTRDTLLRRHPKWIVGVSELLEKAPEGSPRAYRWAASRLDNLAKPGRFTAAAISDINNAGDKPDTFVGPVVDQNHRFVRYEIRWNRIAYDHVMRNRLFDRAYQPSEGQLPAGFPPESVVVKAAWRVLTDSPEDQRFQKTCFWVPARLSVNGREREEKVALVGLHLVQRTAGRPQWVWASFEHVDNVPEAGQVPEAGKAYSLNYGKDPKVNPVPLPNADPDPELTKKGVKQVPQAVAEVGDHGEGTAKLIPTQVTRERPLHETILTANKKYRADPRLAGTVWANYQLVVCQYPTRPHEDSGDSAGSPYPGSGGQALHVTAGADGAEVRKPFDVNIANTTMETYFQRVTCMECHAKAGGYGISYMFSLGRKFPPEPKGELAQDTQRKWMSGDFASKAPSGPALEAVRAYQERWQVSGIDRRFLSDAIGHVTPLPDDDGNPARPGAPLRQPAAAPPPRVAAEPRPDEDFKEVHEMFHDLMRRWQNQKGGVCPPEIVKRHGKMFGWHPYGNEVYPWVSWDELEKARFSGDDDKAGGLKLIDRDAASVSDMLLIKVVRGELVEAAKNKRMPLNGPYLTPPQIERLVELIGKRYNKPAKK